MALTGAHAPGATPLNEEDLRGLKLVSISNQGELNEAEAQNILRGQEWALRSRTATLSRMLSDDYLLRLHKKMFGDVWKWAGTIRERETNIGVPPHTIRTQLRNLYEEVGGWLEFNVYPPDEIAIRLHYRVVTIHPFPNGNGRHARMLAHMVMVRHFGLNPLSWGVNALRSRDGNRKAYIDALVAADKRDFAPSPCLCPSEATGAISFHLLPHPRPRSMSADGRQLPELVPHTPAPQRFLMGWRIQSVVATP